MRLFPRNYLQGMHDGLVDAGAMRPFPNDKVAMAVFDQIADEAKFPPILERQLSKEAAVAVARRMKTASDKIAASPYAPTVARIAQAKQASVWDLPTRAGMVAEFYMQKAAEEGSLTPQGENTLADAAKDDTVARLDQRNRPEGTYTRGQRGETTLPTPGIIGREVSAPTMGGSSKQAGLAEILAKLKGVPSAIGGHASQLGERLTSNVGDSVEAIRHGTAMLKNPAAAGAADLFRGQRMDGIKNLATQGGAAIGGLGAMGAGAHALMNRGGGQPPAAPGPEEIAKAAMEITANEDMPAPDLMGAEGGAQPGGSPDPEQMGRVMTFLHALKNKIPGMRPSPEAQIGAAGLGEQGEPGMEVMAHILDRAKTAEEADGMLEHILQALTEQGVPPSPELVQAISEAMEGDEGGAEGAPPAGPPAGPPPGPPPGIPGEGGGGEQPPADPAKVAGIMDSIRAGGRAVGGAVKRVASNPLASARNIRDGARDAAAEGASALAKRVATGQRNDGIKNLAAQGVAGAAAVGGGIAAKKALGKKDDGKEVTAEDFWNNVLGKAAENNGSLTPQGENTLADAAKDDTVAKLDNQNRPEGTYSTAQGQTTLQTASGEVGDEKKVAEEAAYWESLRKVAEEWGAKLPATMPHERKREAIQKIAACAPSERAAFVRGLHG